MFFVAIVKNILFKIYLPIVCFYYTEMQSVFCTLALYTIKWNLLIKSKYVDSFEFSM